jgi:hypothetical protein
MKQRLRKAERKAHGGASFIRKPPIHEPPKKRYLTLFVGNSVTAKKGDQK